MLAGRISPNISPWARPTSPASFYVEEEGARADDVLRCGACLGERGRDDLEAAARLAVSVGGRLSVGHHRARARDEDVAAVAHRPREADRLLER